MGKGLSSQIVDVESLPTLPAIAIEAIRLMEGKKSSFHSIADLLKNDQVLSSRILHYANSAYVGAQKKVTSISRAISLIGFNTVRSTILSVSIFDCFSGQLAKKKQKSLVNFWLHSIGVAVTAQILAKKFGFPEPEEAYMAGLVHDLGKLVNYLQHPKEFQKVCDELESQGSYSTQEELPLDVERSIMDTDHVETGKQLADWWDFPEAIGRVMWLHHQPIYETILPDESDLPKLIRFADVLCVTHNVGSSYFLASSNFCHEHFHFALENIVLHNGLTPEDINSIMQSVHERVKEVAEFLGIWDEKTYRQQISSANVSLGSLSINLEKNNRQLTQMSRVLNAACEMTRQLNAGLSLADAAQKITLAAKHAFGVSRCLCLIRDDVARMFVGQIFENNSFHEILLPMQLAEMKKVEKNQISDIESEALQHLERTTTEISQGSGLESGMINMLAGSRFLATFFMANKKSPWSKNPILGELVVDFADSIEHENEDFTNLKKQFEALSLAASNALEKTLLEKDLARQTHQMAEASRKMEESQRQLFHSHRLATVGRLAAGAAHEINNPLTIISLNVQMLEGLFKKIEVDKQVADRLKTISEQSERISKIIQDLMGFAHPAQPDFRQASISAIMDKVLSVLGDRVSMVDIEVENNIPSGLPFVMVDPLQIEQVFMNLLINANHAMPDNGKVFISAASRRGFVEINIIDTGEGIPKENLGKIFDPFFTTKKEGEGTGLGLAICHSIVEHNGGIMKVESNVGAGTTFTVILPTDKSSRLKDMKKSIDHHKEVPVSPEAAGKYRILVIDDEHIINDTLRESLQQAGYETDGAYDGVEGIGLLRYKKYDLVLLDIRMPRKDGLEVLEFVRNEFPDIQIIIITGLASMEEIQETVKMGAFACLKKPFRLDDVLERVAKALKVKE
jgi:signal transduction histidine kinase/HD-like signal output (HDOD) protein